MSWLDPLFPLVVLGSPNRPARVTDDSREVEEDCAFVAVPGISADGHAHIPRAIAAGCPLVLCERIPEHPDPRVCFAKLADTRAALPTIAQLFYGEPCKEMKVFGVTGTNGKTTSSYLFESLGSMLGHRVGIFGTISHRMPGYSEKAANTTPGLLKMMGLLHRMRSSGVDWVGMEVSSHGLHQGRLDGVLFDVAAWTNLGRDHLDYHHSMEEYAAAKRCLFDPLLERAFQAGKQPIALCNADDAAVARIQDELDDSKWGGGRMWTSSRTCQRPDTLLARALSATKSGYQVELEWRGQRCPSSIPLSGRFNVDNALIAVGAALCLGHSLQELAARLPQLAQVPGRLEAFGGQGAPRVFVDFAHTPEALASVLESLRSVCSGRLFVVFGAGGDRDPGKRGPMGSVAAALADAVVLTNDNPRSEPPASIIDAILAGVPTEQRSKVEVEADRRRAVAHAVGKAQSEDIVLVAGKGHEGHQLIGQAQHRLDDRELVVEALQQWKAEGIQDD
ncbi:MAG: UDP-N-acetylmuramoyl-L-alanyl-D-glutamate--2,6-diaminopimelate ligase [Myxococcota bacterium]|jgi:UDP-N-acetylmuramyl-tripeptide synthetase|nr:UDP-N-acetylmuramoyl-L-alanyl-D-glutamate--2,6-diaminopimelate ligase [Myxococcota bacterium]